MTLSLGLYCYYCNRIIEYLCSEILRNTGPGNAVIPDSPSPGTAKPTDSADTLNLARHAYSYHQARKFNYIHVLVPDLDHNVMALLKPM